MPSRDPDESSMGPGCAHGRANVHGKFGFQRERRYSKADIRVWGFVPWFGRFMTGIAVVALGLQGLFASLASPVVGNRRQAVQTQLTDRQNRREQPECTMVPADAGWWPGHLAFGMIPLRRVGQVGEGLRRTGILAVAVAALFSGDPTREEPPSERRGNPGEVVLRRHNQIATVTMIALNPPKRRAGSYSEAKHDARHGARFRRAADATPVAGCAPGGFLGGGGDDPNGLISHEHLISHELVQ